MQASNRDFEHLARVVIRDEVRRTVNGGREARALAERAGISETTVWNLAYGDISCAQVRTVMSLLDALGFAVRLERAAPHFPANVVPLHRAAPKAAHDPQGDTPA